MFTKIKYLWKWIILQKFGEKSQIWYFVNKVGSWSTYIPKCREPKILKSEAKVKFRKSLARWVGIWMTCTFLKNKTTLLGHKKSIIDQETIQVSQGGGGLEINISNITLFESSNRPSHFRKNCSPLYIVQ